MLNPNRFVVLLLAAILTASSAGAAHRSDKATGHDHLLSVEQGDDGRLIYTPDAQGNVIPDFSNCGYHGGGVALPDVPVRETVHASGGEDGPAIQAAIDRVSKLPLDAQGVRGAVLLTRGTYHIAGTITIGQGGVVLRGEGDGKDGTVLVATGTGCRMLIQVGIAYEGMPGKGGKMSKPQKSNRDSTKPVSAARASDDAVDDDDDDVEMADVPADRRALSRGITDDYVPVGAHSFTVEDAAGFKGGDHVIVHRPSTAKWIHAIGMDRIPPKKDTVQWTANSKNLKFDRVITAITGNQITLDAPLANAFERKYGGGTLSLFKGPEPISESGVENLSGVSEFHGGEDEKHAWIFIRLRCLKNGYVRHVTAKHFGYSAVGIDTGCKWVTVQDCACLDPVSQIKGGRRYSFYMEGCSLCLVQRCVARNGRHDFVMHGLVPGPNVFLDCHATKTHADSGPHQRWSVGTLWDNIEAGEINIRNRGNSGTGHGWAGANQVVWNCTARDMIIENPPTAQNWAIGCKGAHKGNGNWESIGHQVLPRSLSLAQLQDRLGPQAVANIANKQTSPQY